MTPVILVFCGAAVVLAVCVLFVLHRDYHAGVIGTTGLAMVALAAVGRLAAILEMGGEVAVTPIALVAWTGLAMFFGRLAWRFLSRCRARGVSWYDHPPRPAAK